MQRHGRQFEWERTSDNVTISRWKNKYRYRRSTMGIHLNVINRNNQPKMTHYKILLLYALFFGMVRVHASIDGDCQDYVLKRTMPAYALALDVSLLNSTQCRSDLNEFRMAVHHRTLWSMKMLDSSGQSKPGFLYGNNYWLGRRSQCDDASNRIPLTLAHEELLNNTKYRNPEEEFPPFELNYFVARFRHNSTMQYHVRLANEDLVTLGLCLPASCTTSEIGLMLKRIFRERTLLIGDLYFADFKLVDVRDLQDDHQWMSGKMIFVVFILLLTLMLMLIGTAYDVLVHQKNLRAQQKLQSGDNSSAFFTLDTGVETVLDLQESSIGKFLLCFSIYTNTRSLFDTKLSSDTVAAIHGMKSIGMPGIILFHAMFYAIDYTENRTLIWRNFEGFANQVLTNGTLFADTFLFFSGFLLTYVYLNAKNDKQERMTISYVAKIKEFFVRVVKRYIRLTPAYMMTIGIAELTSGYHEKTSAFYMSERPDDLCAKYWWRNLLYINTIFGRENMCLSWSWYVGNDMLYSIIGIFLLILSTIHITPAVVILCALFISSTILTGYISYINEFVPTIDHQYHLLSALYDPPWVRIGPYLVGMATGYIVIKLNKKLPLTKTALAICWCLGSSCNLIVLFGLIERNISILSAAVYTALNRSVWAVGLAWILIACQTNHGGAIHQLLSFKIWVPLSKLTYCVYLVNPILIRSVWLYSETPNTVDLLPNLMVFVGYVVSSFFCAYIFSLMMEMPYMVLMRQFVNSRTRRK